MSCFQTLTVFLLAKNNPDDVRARELQPQICNHWQIETVFFASNTAAGMKISSGHPGLGFAMVGLLDHVRSNGSAVLGVAIPSLPFRARGDLVQRCPQITLGRLRLR